MSSTIHPRTKAALTKHGWRYDPEHDRVIVEEGYEYEAPVEKDVFDETTGQWKIVTTDFTETYYSPPRYVPAVKRDDGRWIAAEWDNRSYQWKCWDLTNDFVKNNPGARYVFARHLNNLNGCRSYRSLVDLVKSYVFD